MFELTGEYHIILPLMLAIALAVGLSKLLSKDTIYTRKLLRRGIDLHAPDRALNRLTVAAAPGRYRTRCRTTPDLHEMAGTVHRRPPAPRCPSSTRTDEFRGVVLAIEVERAVHSNAAAVTAADLAQTVPVLRPDQGWETALSELTRHGGAGLPVADGTAPSPAGSPTATCSAPPPASPPPHRPAPPSPAPDPATPPHTPGSAGRSSSTSRYAT